MSERTTEQLVRDLAQDAPAVRPIPRVRSVAAGVLAMWLLALALMWVVGPPPADFLRAAAMRLTNEVTMEDGRRFVRVFVEVTGKPPSTTEPH